MMRTSASSAKTLLGELSGTVITQKVRRWKSVESGRRWNGGRVASPRKEHYWGSLARVYEFRAARWYPPAFGYASDFGHRCTRSHLDDWLYCMVRTLGEHHRTSIKGKGGCQKELQSMIGREGWTILRRLYERSRSGEKRFRMTLHQSDEPAVQTCFSTLEGIGRTCPRRLSSVHVVLEGTCEF